MILVIDICKEKLHYLEFVKPIEDILLKENTSFFTRNCLELKDSDIKKSDKIIICGTSLKDNDFMMHLDKFGWIKSYKKPILGICGGSHIMGLALNYKLKKKKDIGLKELSLKEKFLGITRKLQVYHLHQFSVLPEVFHMENMYATLFHPEVRNKEIIKNFAEL